MKNFSDLLAIEPKLDLVIKLRAISDNGDPFVSLSVNGEMIHLGQFCGQDHFQLGINPKHQTVIELKLTGKKYCTEKETAIVIEQISIGGFEIVPNWTQLAQYDNDHDDDRPTAYLGYNGTWKLIAPANFYAWRHQITGQGWLLQPC